MQMQKAWDLKPLVEVAKEKGLPLLEEQVVLFANLLLDWVEESIKLTDTKFDDMALMAMPLMRQYAEKLAHKISPDEEPVIETVTGEPQAQAKPILPQLPNA